MTRLIALVFALVAITAQPTTALAWGASGHRMIGVAAMHALPSDLPAFLRTPAAAVDVGELSREPDRSRGAGHLHDSDRDPGHFLDLSDDGTILGGPRLSALPPTRAAYDAAIRAVGQDSWRAGYLPYSIVDRYQQLTLDLAYWRVLKAAEAQPKWKAHRAWFAADRRRREVLILATIGQLSHFVGDGSQPLHVTIHFNGWGEGLNPDGYTNARIHAPFESELVRAGVSLAGVEANLQPARTCRCSIDQRVADYLADTGRLVIPLYQLEKVGGLASGDPRGITFAAQRLGVGASELRDLIVQAWQASATANVGYKPVAVADVLSGKVDPYPALYGTD